MHNQVQASGGSFMADKRWWFGLALMIIGEVTSLTACASVYVSIADGMYVAYVLVEPSWRSW